MKLFLKKKKKKKKKEKTLSVEFFMKGVKLTKWMMRMTKYLKEFIAFITKHFIKIQ